MTNEAFIWHLFDAGVEDDVLNIFETHKGKRYRTKKGLIRLLNTVGLGEKKLRLSCLEAGFVGFIQETLKPQPVRYDFLSAYKKNHLSFYR